MNFADKADLKARLAREPLETLRAIQSGFEDIEAGRVKSADEVHESLRQNSFQTPQTKFMRVSDKIRFKLLMILSNLL
ncbi:MAG: hypothetical protein ACI957_002954 [Verrucomicrobiales bacterium]|jgi:hypothetical protein